MLRLAAVLTVLMAGAAVAQQPAPQPKTYTLTLSDGDLGVVWNVLQELPYKTAAPILEKIQEQVVRQDAEGARPPQPKQDRPSGQ